jgi:signal transduction histidine kinase
MKSFPNFIAFFTFYLFINSTIVCTNAQSYATYIFNNESGIASNLVKSICQDDQGYIWIATDVGLVKFDGKNFVTFQKKLPSLLIKDVHYVSPGKLLIVSDLGVGYFNRKGYDYNYFPIAETSKLENNTSLYYPKTIFTDGNNRVWISDLTGISTIINDKIKKYEFSSKYHVYSIFRSFLLLNDDKNNLIATARPGYFFIYNKEKDSFDLINSNPQDNIYTIDALVKCKNGNVLIGTNNGIYNVSFSENYQQLHLKKLASLQQVSSIVQDESGNLFVGTWENGLYFGKFEDGQISLSKFSDLNFSSIKNLFMDRDKNIWVSSDEGCALIQRTYFEKFNDEKLLRSNRQLFTQEIHSGTGNHIYFTDSKILYKVVFHKNHYSRIELFNPNKSNIQSFYIGKNGVWLSYGDNTLELRDKKSMRLIFKYKLADEQFNALYVDKKNNLWAYLPRSRRIIKLDDNYKAEFYNLNFKSLVAINTFKESSTGTLYCVGTGYSSFIFTYNGKTDTFKDISPKLPDNNYSAPIQVNDFYIKDSSQIYLATNFGIFLDKKGKLTNDTFPVSLTNTVIKAIKVDSKNRIWLGTERGIYVIENDHIVSFEKKDGLPNSSIVANGLAIDDRNVIWVGTASGVAYSAKNQFEFIKTHQPVLSKIIKIGENGVEKNVEDSSFILGTKLRFTFNTLDFPSDRTVYNYRLIGLESSWISAKTVSELNFFSLPAGSYKLQVRSKSPGHMWSNFTEYDFSIFPPWYISGVMLTIYIILGIVFVIIIVTLLYMIKIKNMKERENLLERMVNDRTNDLKLSKEKTEKLLAESETAKKELEKATEQKSQVLSMAAHNLKNPLQSIIGFSTLIDEDSDNSQIKNMAKNIYSSSKEMISQISDLLETAAMESKNLKLDLEPVNIQKIMDGVIKKNYNRAKQKDQKLIICSGNDLSIIADEHWLNVAIDNLVSNAIKYSPFGKSIEISCEVIDQFIRIKVKDDGVGLTEEDMKKLFNKYQRLTAKPTGGESSTGLGLAIVKDIIEKHNGKVWAESNTGNGATFIIQLPISQPYQKTL